MARALWHVAPLIAYYCTSAAALGVVLWRLATARYTARALLVDLAALLLALLMCVRMWPPLQALLPRVEGPQGWRVLLRPLNSKKISMAPGRLDGSGESARGGGLLPASAGCFVNESRHHRPDAVSWCGTAACMHGATLKLLPLLA